MAKLLNILYLAIITDTEKKFGDTIFTGIPAAYIEHLLHTLAKTVKTSQQRKSTPHKHRIDTVSETRVPKRRRTPEPPEVKAEASTSGALEAQDSKATSYQVHHGYPQNLDTLTI